MSVIEGKADFPVARPDFSVWHETDFAPAITHVRSWGQSGPHVWLWPSRAKRYPGAAEIRPESVVRRNKLGGVLGRQGGDPVCVVARRTTQTYLEKVGSQFLSLRQPHRSQVFSG
jgi:hypothetical protein